MVAYILYPVFFIFGLIMGSFLNVLALRYEPSRNVFARETIDGRSHCPYCGKTLGFGELVPIFSFLFQGGKCRSCRHLLSFQYPIVEFLSGLIFVAVPFFLFNFYRSQSDWIYVLSLIWALAFLIWLLMVVIDIKHYVVPDELNIGLAILGAVFILVLLISNVSSPLFKDSFLKHYILLFSFTRNIILNHLVGALIGGLFFGIFTLFTRGRAMGLGDVKLAAASGLLLGWPDIGLTIVLAFIIGGVFTAGLMIVRRKKIGDKIPFAPFFVLGAALTVFFGYQIVNLYFRLFQIS